MSNKELYKKTFSQIHTSENRLSEVIQMKDKMKKKHSVSKKLIVIAACIGALLSAGVAANAATDGELAKNIIVNVANATGDEELIKKVMVYFTDSSGNKSELAPESKIIDEDGKEANVYKPDEDTEIYIADDSNSANYSYEISKNGSGEDKTFVIEYSEDISDTSESSKSAEKE